MTFVAETVGLEESDAQMLVQHELDPKYRNVLSFEEQIAFERVVYNTQCLKMLELENPQLGQRIQDRYDERWSPESLNSFMQDYGQDLSLSLVEALLSLVRCEEGAEQQTSHAFDSNL